MQFISQRAAAGASAADRSNAEWAFEGGTNAERQVVADGDFTRYQGSAYDRMRPKRAAFAVNVGGTAGDLFISSCPWIRDRSF